MINDNSDEIEFILWDEQDDENNSSWIYGRIRFDKRLWFFPEVLSFSPSLNYRHPRRQSNLRFFDRQQSNYNFPYKSLETKREIAGLENLPWLEHLPAKIISSRFIKECKPSEIFIAGKCIMFIESVLVSVGTGKNSLVVSETVSAVRSIIL